MSPKADPKTSAGARLERKAFREYLRRQRTKFAGAIGYPPERVIDQLIAWCLGRQARYDAKAGGLGRKSR